MDRFNQRVSSANYNQSSALHRKQFISKTDQIKLYRQSIQRYLEHWDFTITLQVLLDSLDISELNKETYIQAMRSIAQKGVLKYYGQEKKNSGLSE